MEIKYSDCSNGYQYGPDRKQLNNWNPNKNYGNEYVNVHFRIETNGYDYPNFIFKSKDREHFTAEITKIFTDLGWECKEKDYNGRSSTWMKGNSHLYLHPQDFSGEILKNEVKIVAEALTGNKTFCLRWVDLYETVYDLSNEEYEKMLSIKNNEIRSTILQECKTSRTYLFHNKNALVNRIASLYHIPRIDDNNKTSYFRFMRTTTIKYITQIVDKLIEEGYIVETIDGDKGNSIRTINKTEQKQEKLYI